MNPESFNQSIAHIRDGENVFQVLNEDGVDWDETATHAAYEAFRVAQ